ncbi:MAG: hypothetical protein ABSG51_02895 [Terracidiphilus sp.]|jgi:hypothetical protein
MADTDQHKPNDELPDGSQPGTPGGGADAGSHDEVASGKELHGHDAVPTEYQRPVYHFDLTPEAETHSSDAVPSDIAPLHADEPISGTESRESPDHPAEDPLFQYYLTPAAVTQPPDFGSAEADSTSTAAGASHDAEPVGTKSGHHGEASTDSEVHEPDALPSEDLAAYSFLLTTVPVPRPPDSFSTEAEANHDAEPVVEAAGEEPQSEAGPKKVEADEPATEPFAAPLAEPVAEPVAETVAEPLAQPVAEPLAEPVVDILAEPVATPPTPTPEPPKARSKTGFYILIGSLSFVILIVISVAVFMMIQKSSVSSEDAISGQSSQLKETRDLGTVDSKAAGLKGHLTTKWNEGLVYNFVVEPDDPARQAGFESTVSNPPRPASFTVQIKGADGIVLCSKEILLRFDPRQAAAIDQASTGKQHGAKAAAPVENEQQTELDRQAATETEREHDKGIFQINKDSNGRVGSISSQGEIPCPQNAYQGMGYWSFLPDFPTPEEQDAWANQQTKAGVKDDTGGEANTPGAPGQESGAHQRKPNKAAAGPGTFSIAGDDSIVGYDASTGNIETRGGKVFSIDKAGADAHAIQAYDLPVSIHYACNESAACTLTHGGAVMAHAKLSR